MNRNPLLLIDGYKLDHRRQFPKGTRKVFSNWTPRDSRIQGHDHVIFFGLQYFLKRYLMEEFDAFFKDDEDAVARRYQSFVDRYLGPNSIGTEHIRGLHRLGHIPLKISALPEGTAVPLRVPMLTVENTHPDFFWLPNYFETLMSSVLWQPCTSATTAFNYRKVFQNYAEWTGAPKEFVDWQGHDFSFRGMAGPEAAALSGAGHLLFFTGTDTIPAIELIDEYYPTYIDKYLIGGSVAATEHSVMCAGGETSELETFERLLHLYPTGIVSIVSDTWDLWNVITNILPKLKDRIMARDGKLVIRPDSGDPVKILCGDPDSPDGSPAQKGVVELLWDIFGGTMTPQGYRVLDSHIGTIYGDSITVHRAQQIMSRLSQKGFASCAPVLGIGSYTYQYVTRDTYGFAMKATWVDIDGEGKPIFKNPKTDNGVKKSARGRLAVTEESSELVLIEDATPEQESESLLEPVWEDGKFIQIDTFKAIRERARTYL